MDSRTHIMEPSSHTNVLPQKSIWIEISGPQTTQAINLFRLDLHNKFVPLF